ncbi:MAG: hypothetical protein QM648_01850 [Solirubrobacterales bacterium]
MEVFFEEPGGERPGRSVSQSNVRIRWGNVALAGAALVAVIAAVAWPTGGDRAPKAEQEFIPPQPTAPVAAPKAHPARTKKRTAKRRIKRRLRRPHRRAGHVSAPPPSIPAQTSTPQQPPAPAAEREFGL